MKLKHTLSMQPRATPRRAPYSYPKPAAAEQRSRCPCLLPNFRCNAMESQNFHGNHGILWYVKFHVIHRNPWTRWSCKQYMGLYGFLGFSSMGFCGIPGIPWTPCAFMVFHEIPWNPLNSIVFTGLHQVRNPWNSMGFIEAHGFHKISWNRWSGTPWIPVLYGFHELRGSHGIPWVPWTSVQSVCNSMNSM